MLFTPSSDVPADASTTTDSDLRTLDRAAITFVALFLPSAGYLYYSMGRTQATFDAGIRGAVIAGLLLFFVLLLLFKLRTTFPLWLAIVAAPIVYMATRSIATYSVTTYISPLTRWLLYFAGAFYFYRLSAPLKGLRLFFVVSACVYVVTLLVDMSIGRALHINQAIRYGGGVGSPLGFAAALFVTGFGLLGLYYEFERKRYLALLVLVALALVFTATRSITAALVLGVPAFVVFQQRGFGRTVVIAVLAAIGIVAAATGILLYTDLGARLTGFSLATDPSAGLRFYIVDIVAGNLNFWERIFGLGLGSFPEWFEAQTGMTDVAPHMELVWLIAEGGLVGLLMYVGTIVFLLSRFIGAWRSGIIGRHLLLLCVLFIFIQQTVFQLINPAYHYQAMLPVYCTIGAVLGLLPARVQPREEPAHAS